MVQPRGRARVLAAIAGVMAVACRDPAATPRSRPSPDAAAVSATLPLAESAPVVTGANPGPLSFDDTRSTVAVGTAFGMAFVFRGDAIEWREDGTSAWRREEARKLVVVDAAARSVVAEYDVGRIATSVVCSDAFVWADQRGDTWSLRMLSSQSGPPQTLASFGDGEGVSNLACAGTELVACSCGRTNQDCTIASYAFTPRPARVLAKHLSFPGLGLLTADDRFVYWLDASTKAILRVSVAGGAVAPFARPRANDGVLLSLSATPDGLIWVTMPSEGEPEPRAIRLLSWGRDKPVLIDEHIGYSDRRGRYVKDGRLFRVDAKTGRGVLLAEGVEGGVTVGDALLWLRHVPGAGTSPGRYVVERTPFR